MKAMLWQEIAGETTRPERKFVQWVDLDARTDHYRTLGVEPSVSAPALKRAFYRLAAQYHPDKHQGESRGAAEARMKELNAAYSVLRIEESRANYDVSLTF